jgi:hypothetical protein
MSDLNSTVLTKKDILQIIDNQLFSSVESVTDLVTLSITLFSIMITIYILIIGYQTIKIGKIASTIKDEVLLEIDKKFNIESKMIEEEFNRKLLKHLRYNMKVYKEEAQKEEFIRNVIFKNLSELLSDEIRVNGEFNLNEVFNLYSDRLYLVSQLTSGNEKEVKIALKKLSTGTYYKILRLEAFQTYLNILETKSDIDIDKELYEVKKAILDIEKG